MLSFTDVSSSEQVDERFEIDEMSAEDKAIEEYLADLQVEAELEDQRIEYYVEMERKAKKLYKTGYDIIAYIDGACKGNPGIGGWGVFLVSKDGSKELFGAEAKTTNKRMKLKAAIKAIEEACKEQASSVLVYTDSQYVQKGITKWIKNWKKNGWKKSTGEPVKNIELWKQLDELCSMCNITWQWVDHNDNPGNERADELANMGINQMRGSIYLLAK